MGHGARKKSISWILTMEQNFFLRNLWYYALPGGRLKPGSYGGKNLAR